MRRTASGGRFEGVDQRVIDARALEEVSIGDYILSGGELAALAAGEQVLERAAGATIPLEAYAGIRHRDDRRPFDDSRDRCHQISFSTARSVRLKMRMPSTRNSTDIAAPMPTVSQSSWSGKKAAR